MSTEEMERIIAHLQAQVEQLQERVAELEQQRPSQAPGGEVWNLGPNDSYPWGDR